MLLVCRVTLLVCLPSAGSRGVGWKEEGVSHLLESPSTRRITAVLILGLLSTFSPEISWAQAPPAADTPQKTGATEAPAQPSEANNASEVSTHDNPATFKVRVNLVLVRVVVRDSLGKVVTGLKKEDFQLSDNRKPQVISTFSVETPESHKLAVTTLTAPAVEPGGEAAPLSAPVAALPQRFVALMFDDTNMLLEDTAFVRDAATRLFGALSPSDRVG